MSIEPTLQHITNEENELAFCLYDLDNQYVLRWKFHGEETTEGRNKDGQWTIQSVEYQEYLGFENTPKDGTPAVGLKKLHLTLGRFNQIVEKMILQKSGGLFLRGWKKLNHRKEFELNSESVLFYFADAAQLESWQVWYILQ
ncbi:hypothetical protein V8E53_008738 [Lactarius tabidus]